MSTATTARTSIDPALVAAERVGRAEACRMLGVGEDAFNKIRKAGKLRSLKFPGCREMFLRDDLVKLIEESVRGAGPEDDEAEGAETE
jgi:hypothetical protein